MRLLIKILIMANFVLYYRYLLSTGRLLYDDLSSYSLTGSYGIFSAYNPATGILYVQKNGTPNKLVAIRVSDKTELYTYNIPSNGLLPLFCSPRDNDRLWCIATPANKYIYRFEKDLSSVTTYTLKTGNPLGNAIHHLAPTWDLEYFYMVNYAYPGKIAKYALANLDGGDPEWSRTTAVAYPAVVFTDEDGYVYYSRESSDNLYKLDKTDGTQLWSADGCMQGFYSKTSGKIYVADRSSLRWLELTTAGATDGYTAAISGYMYPTQIYPDANENYIYALTEYRTVGGTDYIIRKFDFDWANDEAYISGKLASITYQFMGGDPSGYLYNQMLPMLPLLPSKAIYTSSDLQFAFREQSIWGTAENDSADKIGILTDGFGINSKINFIDYLSGRSQRYTHLNNVSVNQKGALYETTKFKTPAVRTQLDYFLYGIFQNVVETANGANYQKTFTFPLRQPDFTINEGKYFTVWAKQPIADVSQKIDDSIFNELILSCSPDNEGILWIDNLSYIARNHTDLANPSGTITYPTIAEYFFYDLTKAQINSTNLVLNNFVITIRNNAKKLGFDSGKFQTYCLPRYEAEIELQLLYDSLAQTLMGYAKNGTAINFEFQWGTANNDGYLNISGNAKISEAINFDRQDLNYVKVKLFCCGVYGTTEPFQIEMINSENRGWS